MNNCPSDYYQFNFQCYKEGCPIDTSTNEKKCVSNYNYCYIDEQYKNQCSNEKNNLYIYNFDNTKQYLKSCSESLIYTIYKAKTYLYNGICYLTCPENTFNNDEKETCDCLYFGYYSETNENDYICYSESEICNSKIPVIDLKICLDSIDKCIEKNYKIFNNECFVEGCPENSEIKSGDNHCSCKYYFYNDKINNKFDCFNSSINSCEEKDYKFSNPLTNECFNSLKDCFSKNNNYFFNNFCYKDSCSDYMALSSISDEETKNDFINNLLITNDNINRICVCNIFNNNIKWNVMINDGIYTQECVTECQEEYKPNNISKRCIESCLSYKHYIFNENCYYEACPEGTKLREEGGHICICQNYFLLNNDNHLVCYNSLEDCQNDHLIYYNEDAKQCFSSLENCFLNNFNNYFNKICYNNGCPTGTIPLSDITENVIKEKFINILELENNLIDKICVCDVISENNLKWIYNPINKEQECVNICIEDLYEEEIEPITRKCIEKCNPLDDYIFNNICYKYNCPEGTKLLNDGTRNCICENKYYIDEDNNDVICCTNENEDDINCIENIIYPQEYYENPEKCLAVYNNTCYLRCPEGTCLTQKDINLKFCVKIKSNMKVFNDICFINFEKIENNIKNISDNNLYIKPSPNITIKAYTKKNDEIISNFSFIELGECEILLEKYYNLQSDTKLYILGVESPNKNKKSPINVYNYGVYLSNGTQLNLSICEGKNIILYSSIENSPLIKLEEAIYFYKYGYDIYNNSDNFYIDICSPASINGNDITLNDRYIDFYPSNISMCNDSCKFMMVNLTSEKIKCQCDINIINNDLNDMNSNKEKENEEYTYTYLEYFLSLINYKIILCQKLLLDPKNFVKNIGFYIGEIISITCFSQMLINMTLGIKSLNKIIIENEPNKLKMKENLKINFNNKRRSSKSLTQDNCNNNINSSKNSIRNYNPSKRKKVINSNEIKMQNISYRNKFIEINNRNIEKSKDNYNLNINNVLIFNSKNIKMKKEEEQYNKKSKNRFKEKKQTKNNNIETIAPLSLNLTDVNRKIQFKKGSFKKTKLKFKNNNGRKYENLYAFFKNNDEDIEKKDLNEVPYTQALRLDKRSFIEIFLYSIANKIEIINIFYYRNEYVHLSMNISLYIFEFLLDISLNCFLYTDDVVSEKYHNDGSLELITSLSLSLVSNIISSIIIFFLGKLGEYSDFIEIIIRDIHSRRFYYINMLKFRKYLKLRLSGFYVIQLMMCFEMTYYITIFCIIYSESQVSIMINYIYEVLESLAISFGIALIISILRYFSLKYKIIKLYRISQYIYNRF